MADASNFRGTVVRPTMEGRRTPRCTSSCKSCAPRRRVRTVPRDAWFGCRRLPLTRSLPARFEHLHHRRQPCLADLALHVVDAERHDDAITVDAHPRRELDAVLREFHRLARRRHLAACVDDVPGVPVILLPTDELHVVPDAEPRTVADPNKL